MSRLGLGGVAIALLVLLSAPAHAQAPVDYSSLGIEHIARYDFDATIEDDGDLLVVEELDYDFGDTEHHGIFRDLPTRLRYDDTYDRVYRLHDVDVSSETAPDAVAIEDAGGGITRLRIGDADRVISGLHHYRIAYRLEGTLNDFPDHIELYWNAIGEDWSVPIVDARATVHTPVPVDRAICFTGPKGSSLPCENSTVDGRTATFTETELVPFEALTFVLSVPPGSVAATGPILEERWTAQRAFTANARTVSSSFGLLGAMVAGTGLLLWRVGRDRRSIGTAVDVAFGEGSGEERVPLLGGYDGPVQVEPPDGIRPGQVGTLIDERANALDVTATIVDLAVRGYIRIEEIPEPGGIAGWFTKPDWKLIRLRGPDDALLKYESVLLTSLFADNDDGDVDLSDLKNKFAERLKVVQRELYKDAVRQGWFRRSPQDTRARWMVLGVLVLVAGIGLTVLAAAFTRLGLVPIPIAIGGILLMACSGRMPHRTPAGTGALIRTLGFKRFIDDSERDRARFAEQQHLFSEYLPYAVVFGATEKWARAFEGLEGQLPDQSGWYVGSRPFTIATFSHTMDGFATTSAGTIASTPSGSGTSGFGGGGGFSGGGGGGGGGGSW